MRTRFGFLVTALLVPLVGGAMFAGPVAAQTGDPCANALNGIAPPGYEIVYGNGGSGSQVVLGTEGADSLEGGSGNDILCGFGGNDTLDGGAGSDYLDAGTGSNALYGGAGNDTLIGVEGDVFDGGSGRNQIIANPAALTPCELTAADLGYDPAAFDNIVAGTDGSDILTGRGTAGADLFCGFGGFNVLDRLDAGDVFIGGADDDSVFNNLNGGTFIGGAGNDTVSTMNGGTFDGGAGDDSVTTLNGGVFAGGGGNEYVSVMNGGTFNGGMDNDTVIEMVGGTFDGGDGFDRVVSYRNGTVTNVEDRPL
jgi:hypothetical protein